MNSKNRWWTCPRGGVRLMTIVVRARDRNPNGPRPAAPCKGGQQMSGQRGSVARPFRARGRARPRPLSGRGAPGRLSRKRRGRGDAISLLTLRIMRLSCLLCSPVRRRRDSRSISETGKGPHRSHRQLLPGNPRPRSNVHVTRCGWTRPATARPRSGSSAGLHGASVKVSSLRMTASLPVGVVIERS